MSDIDIMATENQSLLRGIDNEENNTAENVFSEQPAETESLVNNEAPAKPIRKRRTKAEAQSGMLGRAVRETNDQPTLSDDKVTDALETDGNIEAADDARILTVETGTTMETPEQREEALWHEIRNAYRTRRSLQGILSGVEKTELGTSVAVVYYNEFRVVIPMKEMYLNLSINADSNYGEMEARQAKIVGNMLGCDIDFIIKGIENKTRTIVASRKDAMLRKRQSFYLNKDSEGYPRIRAGQKVEARILAVSQKVVRVEAFGVECSIAARDLSWDWLGDANERFNVGGKTLIRILEVSGENAEDLSIRADIKSVSSDTSIEKLRTCRIQGKYAGKVTDVFRGVTFIRLNTGVNAIAHSCYDDRKPGKNDDISFVVTHIDEERSVAVGIITRIIKQNL